LSLLYLPQLSTTKPKEPYVPIFATPQAELKTKKRIIVVLNDHKQDLGIWDYRCLSIHGIDAGSCINLAKALNHNAESTGNDAPGLIISNPGQLNYSHKYNRAMTIQSWQAQPRTSLAHPVVQEHPIHNSAEFNRDKTEHISFIFEQILKDPTWARQDAEIYIIGILNGGEEILSYLNRNWDFWASRVAAIALTSVFTKRQTLSWELIQFLRDRARNWKISGAPKDACLVSPLHWTLQIPDTSIVQPQTHIEDKTVGQEKGDVVNGYENGVVATTTDGDEEMIEWATQPEPVVPDPQIICPEFSSAVQNFTEVIFPTVLESILAFFKVVEDDVKGYKNPAFKVEEWEPEIIEAPIPEVEKGIEVMTLEEFEKSEEVGEKVPEMQLNGAVEHEPSQNTNGTTFATFNSLGSHPIEPTNGPLEPQTIVAGVEMDDEILKAAGLM
jgi:hypothetical protein